MNDDEPTEQAVHGPADDLDLRWREAALGVERRLTKSAIPTAVAEMRSLLTEVEGLDEPRRWDRYGEGGPVGEVERQVADLLGKPAAVMFPSGVMAQQSVLRVWSDRQHSRRIALPGLSHLLHHELDGPQLLHGFRYERLTEGPTFPQASDLEALPGQLGVALLELPLRDGGYLLPIWDELVAFSRVCRQRGVPLHLDGARIWESQPHLGQSLAEISGLADSVYVSFYKGLGGLAGAAVAGPEDVVAEARQWRTRHGGTLFTMLPYAVMALRGLRDELPRMGEHYAYAQRLAAVLTQAGVTVFPNPPHTNAFRLLAPASHTEVTERVLRLMEDEHLAVTPRWVATEVPGWCVTEFTVGSVTLDWPVADAAALLTAVIQPDSPPSR